MKRSTLIFGLFAAFANLVKSDNDTSDDVISDIFWESFDAYYARWDFADCPRKLPPTVPPVSTQPPVTQKDCSNLLNMAAWGCDTDIECTVPKYYTESLFVDYDVCELNRHVVCPLFACSPGCVDNQEKFYQCEIDNNCDYDCANFVAFYPEDDGKTEAPIPDPFDVCMDLNPSQNDNIECDLDVQVCDFYTCVISARFGFIEDDKYTSFTNVCDQFHLYLCPELSCFKGCEKAQEAYSQCAVANLHSYYLLFDNYDGSGENCQLDCTNWTAAVGGGASGAAPFASSTVALALVSLLHVFYILL